MKKTCYSILVAFWFFHVQIWEATAFSPVIRAEPKKLAAAPGLVLRSTPLPAGSPSGTFEADLGMFPPEFDQSLRRIEGGGSLRTFKMPPNTERVQYVLKTSGRPMKAEVKLWIGPLREVHTMTIDSQNGQKSPFYATIKFKQAAEPMLQIKTMSTTEFPVEMAIHVPSPERAEALARYTEKIWNTCERTPIQGGPVTGGIGAVRMFTVDQDVDSIQVICWSKDTSKKSLKAKIEILQGPNSVKQTYDLQCGGGSQPYHAIFQTPGPGWTVRVYNKKFVEDGLFEIAVVPFKVNGAPAQLPSSILPLQGEHRAASGDFYGGAVVEKRWWE